MSLGLRPGSMGAFAERFAVPNADVNAVSLPEGVSSVDVAGLGCRFVTAFHALAHRADVGGGDWVTVHGCGGVGQSAVHVADALGANVVAVDVDDGKLERAADLGADETVNAATTADVPGAVRALTGGGAHVSMDALGIAETCVGAVRSLRKRDTHVQVGLTTAEADGSLPVPTDEVVRRELEFLGSLGMPAPRYEEIFRMVAAGSVDPGAVVSETIALAGVSSRLEAMTDYGTSGIPVVDEF